MSDEPSSKRRKMDNKNYYKYQNKPKNILEPGIRGYLVTCNGREKDCVREAYNLLNEYADQQTDEVVAESEKPQSENNAGAVGGDVKEEEEEDISTTLEKEIKTITTDKKFERYSFQQVETKVTNCIFIKTTIKDHHELGVRLMRDIAETKKQKTRYLQRIWPVDAVCKANIGDIKNAAGRLFDKVFLNTEPTTYSVVVNKRHNTSFDRMKAIKEIAELVDFKNPAHKVDLKNPKIAIAIEVVKGLCCISLLPDYFKLKKYNLFELTQQTKQETPADVDEKGEKPADEESKEEQSIDEPQEGKQVADEPKKDGGSVDESKPNESGDTNPDEKTTIKASDEANGEQ